MDGKSAFKGGPRNTLKILICCFLKSSDDTLRMKMILICFLFCFGIFLFFEICSSLLEVFTIGDGQGFDVPHFMPKNMSRCVFLCIVIGTLSFCGLEFFFLILGNSQALFLQRFPSFLILQILLLCRYSDLQSLHCLGFFFCVVCIFHYHFILLSVPALSFAHIFFDLYLTWPFRSLFCFSVTYILLFNISIKAQSRG